MSKCWQSILSLSPHNHTSKIHAVGKYNIELMITMAIFRCISTMKTVLQNPLSWTCHREGIILTIIEVLHYHVMITDPISCFCRCLIMRMILCGRIMGVIADNWNCASMWSYCSFVLLQIEIGVKSLMGWVTGFMCLLIYTCIPLLL